MKRKFIFSIILLILLVSTIAEAQNTNYLLPNSRIVFEDFQTPNHIIVDEIFKVNITVRNTRLLPIKAKIEVNLLDGLLNLINKNIGEQSTISLPSRSSKTFEIECIIREGDTDFIFEKYNIQATAYIEFPRIGYVFPQDLSTIKGIHVHSPLLDKDRIKITKVIVPEEINEDDIKFDVVIEVENEGYVDLQTYVRIDMIERPSTFPEFEKYDLFEGMASVRKELGKSDIVNIKPNNDKTELKIPCKLRETEQGKEEFLIQVLLFVSIDGKEYQVDTSTVYEISHPQPFIRKQNMISILGIVFIILLFLILIVLIIRILYPLYRIKRIKLKEEKERIEKRKTE